MWTGVERLKGERGQGEHRQERRRRRRAAGDELPRQVVRVAGSAELRAGHPKTTARTAPMDQATEVSTLIAGNHFAVQLIAVLPLSFAVHTDTTFPSSTLTSRVGSDSLAGPRRSAPLSGT